MKKAGTLFIVYETSHVASAQDIIDVCARERREPPDILALDAEVEMSLAERNIPFISCKEFRGADPFGRITSAKDYVERLLTDTALARITYRDVPVAELFRLPLQMYIKRTLYFADIFCNVSDAVPNYKSWTVCARGASTGGIAALEENVVLNAARHVGELRGIVVISHAAGDSEDSRRTLGITRSGAFHALFHSALFIYNFLAGVFTRPSAIRIIASDYWKHLAPFLQGLPEAELVLYDRAEIRRIPPRHLFKHRMRFQHAEQYLSRAAKIRAEKEAGLYSGIWKKIRNTLPDTPHHGFPLRATAREALDAFFSEDVPRILAGIEGTYAMFERIRPHVVLLRASISRQWHFAVLAFVARALKVPSIEIQHGLEYLGPGSASTGHAAEYIATYGPVVQKELENTGYARDKLPAVGSPRFDAYMKTKPRTTEKAFRALVVVPSVTTGQTMVDSYDLIEYFRILNDALKNIPGSSVTLKMRPWKHREKFYHSVFKESFTDVPYTVAQYEKLESLFPECDVMVSDYSTAILEALQCGMPVVLTALHPAQYPAARFHFLQYAEKNALLIAFTPDEAAASLARLADSGERKRFSEEGGRFMRHNYAFDGHAGQRLAALVREAAKGRE
ncbi:MAG: CDP-glycerol glycerophosphotransferase family protein [bacterium]|nr:CDP-glycerol glycerophosphotransferase family protein [bacterium]